MSGGQAQRVSLARGLIYNADLLLMDEPFVSLDLALKYSLIKEFKKFHDENPKTTLFITHDIAEAVSVADRIIVIKGGKIVYDNDKINEKTEKEIFGLMLKS